MKVAPRASSGSFTTGASPRRKASTRAFAAAEGGKRTRLGAECFMGANITFSEQTCSRVLTAPGPRPRRFLPPSGSPPRVSAARRRSRGCRRPPQSSTPLLRRQALCGNRHHSVVGHEEVQLGLFFQAGSESPSSLDAPRAWESAMNAAFPFSIAPAIDAGTSLSMKQVPSFGGRICRDGCRPGGGSDRRCESDRHCPMP